ncbi:MAG TPA: type II toxin-antitoxin system RelE/ParE family toxin [Acidobacteriaceae bacterium]
MSTTRLRIFAAATESILAQADYCRLHETEGLAKRWVEAVQRTLQQLAQFPQSGPRVILEAYRGVALPQDLRRAIIQDFTECLIFYRYVSSESVVKVLDVMDGRRDLEHALETLLMEE